MLNKLTRVRFLCGALAIALTVVLCGAASAAKKAPARKAPSSKRGLKKLLPKDEPIHITANKLVYNNESKIARFIGKVVATQGDLTIRSSLLHAYYTGKDGVLTKIVAWRKVEIDKKGTVARARKAVFDNTRRIVVMTGSPRVIKKDSVLTGEKMTLFLDKDEVVVENARGRISVQGNQLPWKKKKKKKR